MVLRYSTILLIVLSILINSSYAKNTDELVERLVYGWVEKVSVQPWGVLTKAKLDSGANTSSMHADKIELFEKDGDDWVRFTLEFEDPNDEDEVIKHRIERPVEHNVRIKRHGENHQRRPVVKLDLCIGPHVHTVKFSLTDRGKFLYPVLLGRSFLKKIAVIDPAATFLRRPMCSHLDESDSEQHAEESNSDKQSSSLWNPEQLVASDLPGIAN